MAVTYGSEQTLTVSGWNSLAANARGSSATVDNSTAGAHAATLSVVVDTGGSAPAAGGYFELWLEGSTDGGTTYGTQAGVLLGLIEVPASANTTTTQQFETDAALMLLPAHWRLTLQNRTSQTSGTDVSCTYRAKTA